jgi:hypothetical protein
MSGSGGNTPSPFMGGALWKVMPYYYPPPDAQDFDEQGSIVLPAADGNFHTVLSFQIPKGRNGIVRAYANALAGGLFTDGSGALVFRIVHDGKPFKNRSNILFSLGLISNPVYLGLGLRLIENQIIQFQVKNTSLVPGGANVVARMLGWHYPKEYDDVRINIPQ